MRLNIRNEFAWMALGGLSLVGLIALDVQGLPSPLAVLRLFLGLTYVVFVPGYALQAALFPRREELDGPERAALSLGLSIAVVPPLALILDKLPWGIRLWPIVIGEALVIAACSGVAWWRRGRLPPEERITLTVDLDLRAWWAAQDRTGRIIYGVLAGTLLVATVSATAIIVLPKPAERFTEFYILGPEGLAEHYPYQGVVGQPLHVTMGIANREGVPADYRVEVRNGQAVIGSAALLRLQPGSTAEQPIAFTPTETGDDVQVQFLLFRDGGLQPYRTLRLWIVIEEAR